MILGDSRIIEKDPGEQIFDVDRIVSHENFNQENFFNDIALVRLQEVC